MSKNYSGTYLYGKYPDYEKMLFGFIMEAEEIDKNSEEFDSIIYEVKRRQVTNSLAKVLKSDKIKLMTANKGLPRQFKVFCAKDLKNNKKENVIYIDCTGLLTIGRAGKLVCKDIDIFISYIQSACHTYIYYKDENRLVNNANIIRKGAQCFSELLTYVVDYIAHISSTPKNRSYCKYMCAQYYLYCILGKDATDGTIHMARQISGLSEREANVVELQYDQNTFINIKFFIDSLSKVLRIDKLTIDVVVERWMYLFSPSTVFALELFPAFATMLTDCYIGAYLNNQKTIEKVLGQNMVEFCKAIFKVGDDAV